MWKTGIPFGSTTPPPPNPGVVARLRELSPLWKQACADRYLLRFETSNPALFHRIHPSCPGGKSDRIAMLRQLRELGYEVGSGIMTGIPGQTYQDLAQDISRFHDLDLDLIGIGPWIAHPETPLGRERTLVSAPPGEQVPNTEDIVYRVIALTRLVQPYSNIPTTTALATLNKECGREQGMQRGANIIMPILTPTKYRQVYEIYPGKACITEDAQQCYFCLHRRIKNMGRAVGSGPGPSPNLARGIRAKQ